MRTRSTPSTSPPIVEDEDSANPTDWEASRMSEEKQSNYQPKSFSRRIDGEADFKPSSPIDTDVVVANPDKKFPKSSRNLRGNRRHESEVSSIPAKSNGAFTESRQSRIYPSRDRTISDPKETPKTTSSNRGNRRISNDDRSLRNRRTTTESAVASNRRGRISHESTAIDESKIEVFNLDMDSGNIEALNSGRNKNPRLSSRNKPTTDVSSIETTTLRGRGRFNSRNSQNTESINVEKSTESSRIRSRTRSPSVRRTSMRTEALYDRNEPETRKDNPRSRQSSRFQNTVVSTQQSQLRSRPNYRRTSTSTEPSESTKINVESANRRSSTVGESDSDDLNSDEPISSTRITPTSSFVRFTRKKVTTVSTTEKTVDKNERSTQTPVKSRGSIRSSSKVEKKKTGEVESSDDYDNENYPEHFKLLLQAKEKEKDKEKEKVNIVMFFDVF